MHVDHVAAEDIATNGTAVADKTQLRVRRQSTACSGGVTLTDTSGVITSPGYDGVTDYANSLDCKWIIQAPVAKSIFIKFQDFDTERCCDELFVYDGANNQAPLLGRHKGSNIPEDIASSGNTVFINFDTDDSSTDTGFSLKYTTVDLPPVCSSAVEVLTNLSGVITSPGFGNSPFYASNLGCSWHIQAAEGTFISIWFEHFGLENSFVFLSLYDGASAQSALLGMFTGFTIPQNASTSGNHLFINFNTDGFNGFTGFQAKYAIISPGSGTCEALAAPANAEVTYTPDTSSLDVDTVATYTCAEGYNLNDNASLRTCLPNGIWDGQEPSCIESNTLLRIVLGVLGGAVVFSVIGGLIFLLTRTPPAQPLPWARPPGAPGPGGAPFPRRWSTPQGRGFLQRGYVY